MTKKLNTELTKSEALSVSWKNRKAFKGYDRSKGSSYNSWRAIIYSGKGKDIGFPEEWRDYTTFMADVQGEWVSGKIVCRLDTTAPHSKVNSFWTDKGLENMGKLIRVEYHGITKTILEWCAELNLNYQGVRQRYFKSTNLSTHEILFGRQRKIRDKKERTSLYRSARMFGAYRLKDKNKKYFNDLTLEHLRSEIIKGCIYCGDTEHVGLDRLDNKKGHEKANVVPCCYDCNCARMDNFSYEEMLVIGRTIREIKRIRYENRKINSTK
jgi:hypothetical protein